MTVAVIWAQAEGGVIGADGAIPWRLPEEQQLFKALTLGGTVVMGRRTWQSLPASVRPLPGRRNLVLTRQADWQAPGAETVHGPADLDGDLDGDLWVIGGAEVWAAFLPQATVAVVTRVALQVAGDTYAPVLDDTWRTAWSRRTRASAGTEFETSLQLRGTMSAFGGSVLDVLARSAE